MTTKRKANAMEGYVTPSTTLRCERCGAEYVAETSTGMRLCQGRVGYPARKCENMVSARPKLTDLGFDDMLLIARKLARKELERHASVSTNNGHSCRECFTCACVVTLKNIENKEKWGGSARESIESMTLGEMYSEQESLADYFRDCARTGNGISSKDSIRKRRVDVLIEETERARGN